MEPEGRGVRLGQGTGRAGSGMPVSAGTAAHAAAGPTTKVTTLTGVARAACALVPLMVALSFAGNQGDTAHDASVVRVLGLRGGGPFGYLESLLTAPFMLVPLGTRAYRAAISSAVGAAIVGFLVFELAWFAAARAFGPKDTDSRNRDATARTVTIAAALASFTATLNAPMMLESSVAGGCTWSVVLALLPLYLVLRRQESMLVSFVIGLGFSCDPAVGLFGAATAFASGGMRVHWKLSLPMLLGLLPLGLCFFQGGDVSMSMLGTKSLTPPHSLKSFLSIEQGAFSLVVAAASIFFLARNRAGRMYCYRTLPALLVPFIAISQGAASGPTRYGPAALALEAMFAILVAPAAAVIIHATANLPIPFARATALLLSILFFAIPLRLLDDATYRAHARSDASTLAWERFAVSSLPKGSLYLTSDERVWLRLRAGRIVGSLRDDLEVLPFRALSAQAAPTILREDPHLGALLRDFLLTGEPSENALSKVSAERPVVLDYDSAWNPLLTKHLVPIGAFLKFEPEPRGASERRLALEKQAPERARLAAAIMPNKEPELVLLLARQMERRALALGATGERESVSHAIDDLRAFAPKDPLIEQLVHRIVIAKGAVDTKDLAAPSLVAAPSP